jgi:hypothetical protein
MDAKVENAERRLRSWTKGEHWDTDLATDIRTVLDELESVRAHVAGLDEVEKRARAVVRAYENDKIYAIETGPGSTFMDELGKLCELFEEPF